MSLAESYHVHIGFWTNWSFGKIQGGTLTLSRDNGGLLVAFIAIFVGAAGKSFWRLACFTLHRMLSSPRPQDGIYHQLQAVLRNSDTAQAAAWSLGQVIWAWRVPARFRKPFPRILGIIFLAVLVSASFGIAGVFSSQITTDTANEVLLTGDNCGPLKGGDETDPEAYWTLFQPFQYKRVTAYSSYALQCYSGELSAGAEDCHPFVKAKLKNTIKRNAGCPFSDEMCKLESGNLLLDSGYLDSHADLGINSAPENRFQLRLVHQCAPIVTEGFTNITEDDNSTEKYMQYYYGSAGGNLSYTQEVSLNQTDKYHSSDTGRLQTRADYEINVMKAYGGPLEMSKTFSMFEPIEQLRKSDADTILFFLNSHGIAFALPTDDPWFSAHQEGPLIGNILSDTTRNSSLADEPLSVLGCTMQMQFCNPNLPEGSRCEPLHGMIDDSYPVLDLYKTDTQKTGFQWAMDIIRLGMFSISGIVDSIGISALVARHGLGSNIQGPLPINQWQHEVDHWVSASLASIQGSFVEAGNGPNPKYQQFRRAPNKTDEQHMCQNQKIMTTKYSSFSVLGLGLILVIGGIFILLDFTIESIVDYIQIRRNKKEPNPSRTYARLEWNANTTLHLQRLAHEHIGAGTWKNGSWQHPVTEPGEKLGVIDIRDEERTLFIAPQNWEEKIDFKQSSTAGSDTISWRKENRTTTKTEASDSIESMATRRANTFESIKKAVKHVDTTTTLVNEVSPDDIVASPVLPITPTTSKRPSKIEEVDVERY